MYILQMTWSLLLLLLLLVVVVVVVVVLLGNFVEEKKKEKGKCTILGLNFLPYITAGELK